MTLYVLDTNVFIEAKNFSFKFDECPEFWEWLVQEGAAGQVMIITPVLDEICRGYDELVDWAKRPGSGLFQHPGAQTRLELRSVYNWATGWGSPSPAIRSFMYRADAWLVAFAKVRGLTAITQEKYSQSLRQIKIPSACEGLSVLCVSTRDMLLWEGASGFSRIHCENSI